MAKKKKVTERNSVSSGTYRPKNQRYGSQYGASSSQNYGSSNPYGSTSPVYGYSNALNQHLSSNQTPYSGGLVNTGGGVGGTFNPNSPTPGYSSPTGNYPEPGWPEPGDAEIPTSPSQSPTIPDIFFPSPSGDMPPSELPPVLIENLSLTPPGSGFNFSMPDLEAPEISRIDIPNAGPLGFYSVNEGAAGWSGRGGNVDDLDRFVAGKVGGPEPVRFRAAFG